MKIVTDINISETEKAQMVANSITLPGSNISFEMSPAKAVIFAHVSNDYGGGIVVTNEKITVLHVYVKQPQGTKLYGSDSMDDPSAWISSGNLGSEGNVYLKELLREDIVSGRLKEGDNIDPYLEKLEQKIATNKVLKQASKDIEIEYTRHAEKRAENKRIKETKEKAEKDAKDAEERRVKEAEAKKISEEREKRRLEHLEWAKQYGSDRLRKGLEQGYSCLKQYEKEYGIWVLGDEYEWDRDDAVEEKTRSCPSLKALEIVEELVKDERIGQRNADIQWLPDGLSGLVKEEEWDEDTKKGCEAISVKIRDITGLWYKVI